MRDVGHVAEPHLAAAGRVDRQVCGSRSTLSRLSGVLQTLHVVGLAVAEDVADLLAGHQRGRRAADVAGLERRTAAPASRSTSTSICGTSTCELDL